MILKIIKPQILFIFTLLCCGVYAQGGPPPPPPPPGLPIDGGVLFLTAMAVAYGIKKLK